MDKDVGIEERKHILDLEEGPSISVIDKQRATQEEHENSDIDKWGFAVCFGTIITFIAGIGHVNSFGLIYNDFINDTHSSAKSLTTAHGVFAIMLAFGGIILNIISRRHSLRFGGGYRSYCHGIVNAKEGLANGDLLKCKDQKHGTEGHVSSNAKVVVKKYSLDILRILNVKVLIDPVYCNICIGQSFVNFSDLTFFVLQPMLLFQYGYDTTQVATCISICAGADVAGRCVLAFVSSAVTINTRLLYFVATLLTLVFRLVILQVRDFFWVATVTAVLGALRALLHVASPLVISSHVSHKDFPGAYALFMLAAGLTNVTFAPLIGLLKDVFQDFVPAFYALTLCCVPCLVLWTAEHSLHKRQTKL